MPYRFRLWAVVFVLLSVMHAPMDCHANSVNSNTPVAKAEPMFLFPFFRGQGESGVFLAVSRDGLDYRFANFGQAIFTPPDWQGQHLTRDPSIIQHDGVFHMVWTTNWRGRVMGYASSADLVNWSKPLMIRPFAESLADEDQPENVWAPELHYDPVQGDFFVVFSSTIPRELNDNDGSDNDWDHRLYIIRTKDFKTFTEPKVLFDPGYTSIDGHLVFDDRQNDDPADDRWVMVYKKEKRQMPGKNLWLATIDAKMSGEWQIMPHPIAGPGATISPTDWVEGPSLVRTKDAWLLYWDTYDRGRYSAAMSTDLENWTDLTDKLRMPTRHPRHGTVFLADVSGTVLPLPSFTETDRLQNGDFEHAVDDKPTAWQTNRWSGQVVHKYFPEDGRNGGAAVAIGSEIGADAAWSAYAIVEPRTRYRLSGWIRTEEVRAGSGMGALLSISSMDGARSEPLIGENPWTQVEVIFNSGNRRDIQINCLFGGWGESIGRAWYDDIKLEPVE